MLFVFIFWLQTILIKTTTIVTVALKIIHLIWYDKNVGNGLCGRLVNLFLCVLVCVIQKSEDTILRDRKYPEHSNSQLLLFCQSSVMTVYYSNELFWEGSHFLLSHQKLRRPPLSCPVLISYISKDSSHFQHNWVQVTNDNREICVLWGHSCYSL